MVIFTCLSPAKGSWLSLRSLCGLFLVIRSKIAFKARLVVLAYNYIPLTVKTSQKRFCEVLQPAFKISFLLTQQFCKKLCSKYTYGFLTALIFKISPLNHRYFFSRFTHGSLVKISVVCQLFFFFVHSLFRHQFFTSLSSVSSLIPRLNHLWFTCGYNRLDFRI